jgi:hypothetical protein
MEAVAGSEKRARASRRTPTTGKFNGEHHRVDGQHGPEHARLPVARCLHSGVVFVTAAGHGFLRVRLIGVSSTLKSL